MNQNIFIVIVIYKINISDCITLKSILCAEHINNINVLIYDNSPTDNKVDFDFFLKNNKSNYLDFIYYSDKENPGVSKAYNYAASIAKKMQYDWILILDQDSKLPTNTFKEYKNCILCFPEISVIAPMLVSNKSIISPSIFKYRRGFLPNKIFPGIQSLKRFSPLNSGLMIRLNLYLSVDGYNENVPLDYSDFAFIEKIKKVVNIFYLLPIKFEHKLSVFEKKSFESSIFRFMCLCKGSLNSCLTNLDFFYTYLMLFRRASALTIRYKNFIFYKIIFNHDSY